MAERRMFAKSIVLSDAFLDMPMSARCLYFTLGMFADDDGFVNSPKSIMRQVGASLDDMNVLITKKFVLTFDDGVVVIKHWRINNYLRSDRYKETTYLDEKKLLQIEDNGSYSMADNPVVDQRYTIGIPSIGKDSIDKDSIGENSIEEDIEPPRRRGGVFQRFAGDDVELSKALKEFNEFRNKKKKPMTDEAKERLCKKLEGFPRYQWIAILHQSIDQGWTDIYPIKETTNSEPMQKSESRNFKLDGNPAKYAKDTKFTKAIEDLING